MWLYLKEDIVGEVIQLMEVCWLCQRPCKCVQGSKPITILIDGGTAERPRKGSVQIAFFNHKGDEQEVCRHCFESFISGLDSAL